MEMMHGPVPGSKEVRAGIVAPFFGLVLNGLHPIGDAAFVTCSREICKGVR